ncbi:MAG: glycosyltransferase [Bacillota bacterium]
MLLSVIVAEYNTKKYLSKCLESLMNQTLHNMEIIVIDDHSDFTKTDMEALKNNNITYIYNKENMGLGAVRNLGVKMAKGKYVCFIDSDDWVDYNYFEKACQEMENNSAQIGEMSVQRDTDGLIDRSYSSISYQEVHSMCGETALHILSGKYDFGLRMSYAITNKIFLRDFLLYNNIKFTENAYFEDFAFHFMAYLNSNKVITIPNVRYHYYKRSGSIIFSFSDKHIEDLAKVICDGADFLMHNGYYEKYKVDFFMMAQTYTNTVIKQIFNFTKEEESKKNFLKKLIVTLQNSININDFIETLSAEQIRNHLQPNIFDIKL